MSLIYKQAGATLYLPSPDNFNPVKAIPTTALELNSRPQFLEAIGLRNPAPFKPNPGPLLLCRQLALHAERHGTVLGDLATNPFTTLTLFLNDIKLEALWATGL